MTKQQLDNTTATIVDGTTRRFIRKAKLKARYGDCDDRTIENMVEQNRLPKPYYFGRRFPLWALDELEEYERRAKAHELVTPLRRARAETPDPEINDRIRP